MSESIETIHEGTARAHGGTQGLANAAHSGDWSSFGYGRQPARGGYGPLGHAGGGPGGATGKRWATR